MAQGNGNATAGQVESLSPVAQVGVPQDVAALTSNVNLAAIEAFRQQAVFQEVSLKQMSISAIGGDDTQQIASVGLGFRTKRHHKLTLSVSNAGAGAEIFKISPLFPFNISKLVEIAVQGSATVHSVGGPADLLIAMRNARGSLHMSQLGGYGYGLDPALVHFSEIDATMTPTNAAIADQCMCGIKSISVAAATVNKPLVIEWYSEEKFAQNKTNLMGALPLQNSSVFATIKETMVNSLVTTNATDTTTPFYDAGADVTMALTSYTIDTTYEFATVPNNPALYQAMIQNSYQLQQQNGLTVNATGAEALDYTLPTKQYLTALHILAVDGNGAPLGFADLSKLQLQYGGGVIHPMTRFPNRGRGDQYKVYGHDLAHIAGYFLWDGEATTDSIVNADSMGWLNLYNISDAHLIADVAAGKVTPIKYSVIREQVVAGALKIS